MQVLVQFHRQVEEDLDRWLSAGELDDENREALVDVYIEELIRVLQETVGEPDHAVRQNSSEPRLYRWRYTDEVEIDYVVKTRGPGLFRFRSVRIIVFEIRFEVSQ